MLVSTAPCIAMDNSDGNWEEQHGGVVLVLANERIGSDSSRDARIGTQRALACSWKKIITSPSPLFNHLHPVSIKSLGMKKRASARSDISSVKYD